MRTILYLAIFVFLALPSHVLAQPYEPRADEAAHSAAALKHAEAGDFEAAIAEAEQAVAARGLNVFWLNLGRFQQRAGQCAPAMTSLTNAITAPAVTKPKPKLVRETAQKYIAELADQCPAQVTVGCTPADMTVVARHEDESQPIACGEQVELGGGTWTFVGTYGGQTVEATEELRIARQYDVPLVIDIPVAKSPTPRPKPAPAEEPVVATRVEPAKKSVKAAPVLLFIGAGAAALTGFALDVALRTSTNGELDGMDFVPVGLYLGSIGLVVAGVLLW